MTLFCRRLQLFVLLGLVGLLVVPQAVAQRPQKPTVTYQQLMAVGYEFFTQGKTKEAYAAALMAVQTNPRGFEAYALAAAIMHLQGESGYAKDFVGKAMARATTAEQVKLRELAAVIDKSLKTGPSAAGSSASRPSTVAAPPAPARAPATVAPTLEGSRWSGTMLGTYAYERSASKAMSASLIVTLNAAGQGTASFNLMPEAVRWTQGGADLTIQSVLQNYGCAATLTIRARANGSTLTGAFVISGPDCAEATGTWTATRVQ